MQAKDRNPAEIPAKKTRGKDSVPGSKNILILLLLTTILSHGFLFNARQIEPLEKHYSSGEVVTDSLKDSKRLRTRQQEPLPHWRLATDCSIYSFDCFAVAQNENQYQSYPFSSSLRTDIEASNDNSTVAKHLREEWSFESFDELSVNWTQSLEMKQVEVDKLPVEDRNYLYPPVVPEDDYRTCMDLAVFQNKNTIEQLDVLLSGESPQIVREPDTKMISFTIADYKYVQDMLHDVFQMMDDVVGFSKRHFFLVAIDQQTTELACKYGYPVVFWKEDDNLRDAVANTKMIVSLDLVKRGFDYFFSEMDVWWIRSPKANLIAFQNNLESDKGDHIYFSGHQNNPYAPNIGVYAVKANKHTEEYFTICLDVLKEKPETHDQYVMAEVHNLFKHTWMGQEYTLGGGRFKPDGNPKTPAVENAFKGMYFLPHEVVADERPQTTHQTLAIHTLNGAPLQAPHGKKMIAKELGVYYGFHTQPQTSLNIDSYAEAAGYYDRNGESRRYLWLDTDIRSNFYSIVQPGHYHDNHAFEWTMAILIAIARKTNRIFVLPQVFNADMDAGTYFAWTMMDYSKISEVVDFRETNFLSNPKSWKRYPKSKSIDNWPFESIVNTAMFKAEGENKKLSIYTQVSDRSSVVSKKAWTTNMRSSKWLDAWIGSLSTVPEAASAEVLLVNPDALIMDGGLLWNTAHRLMKHKKDIEEKGKDNPDVTPISQMEREVLEIYDQLGWCWDTAFRHTANKVSASDSCFGIGTPRNYE